MFFYALKRFLVFIPTFFIISLMIFGLSKLAPGDPVELLLKGGQGAGSAGIRADLVNSERAYQEKAQELGLDRPTFYFALTSAAYPKDLYLIKKQNHREIISRLIDQSGNSEAVMAYYKTLRAFELKVLDALATANSEARAAMRDPMNDIYFKYEDVDIRAQLDKMKAAIAADATLSAALASEHAALVAKYQAILDNPQTGNLYVPTIHAYGIKNQYHTWMFGDYPWFSTPDTMAKFQLNQLNARLNTASKELDSLNVKARKEAENLRDARLQIELLKDEEINKDSLQQAIDTKMLADSAALAENIATRTIEYQKVEKERDLISEKVIIYASKGFLRFDFGKSYRNGESVGKTILTAMFWTVIMNFISIFLSYIISIPLGVQSAVWKKNGLQFFNFISYHALFTTLAYSVSMVLYAKGIVGSGTHLVILAACMSAYLLVEFYQKRAYIKESFAAFSLKNLAGEKSVAIGFLAGGLALAALGFLAGAGMKYYLWILGLSLGGYLLTAFRAYLFPLIYIFSLSMVMFWSFIIAEMLIFGAGIFLIRSPKFAIALIVIIAAIVGLVYYLRRRNAAANANQINTKKLWDDGKGNFQLGKTGIQTRGSVLDGFSTAMLFVLYSLPSFWIAMILLVFLTTASYGISWFPTGGAYTMEMHQDPNTPMSKYLIDVLHHLVLPVFCMTYGSFAFLSRQTRGAMLGVLRQDYIRTANAKGLDEEKVIWKHAFRNSLFPIITLFSSVFPRALSGSIAIELIFNIQGMGQLALGSIIARDWPLVFAISMLAAVLTMIGNLIADLLYGVADPRVAFK